MISTILSSLTVPEIRKKIAFTALCSRFTGSVLT